MRKRYVFGFVLFFLVAFTSVETKIVLAQKEGKENLDKVTLRLSWLPVVDDATYVVGLKKGFYLEEGIDLTIKTAKSSDLAVKIIGIREDEFSSASTVTTLIARTKGMPLKVLAVFHQKTPVSILSLKNTLLRRPKDMEGKSLASDLTSMKHTDFKVFCKINNVDINKIKILPVQGSNIIYLLNGDADTMLAFGYQDTPILIKKGIEFNEIKLYEYGVDLLGKGIITHEDLIKENPNLVRRFVRAALKSWNYAVNHPEEAVDALVEYYPELKLNREIMSSEIMIFIPLLQNKDTDKYGLGYQAKEKWEKMQDMLYDQGLIDKKINVEEVYTNEFLPQLKK